MGRTWKEFDGGGRSWKELEKTEIHWKELEGVRNSLEVVIKQVVKKQEEIGS